MTELAEVECRKFWVRFSFGSAKSLEVSSGVVMGTSVIQTVVDDPPSFFLSHRENCLSKFFSFHLFRGERTNPSISNS